MSWVDKAARDAGEAIEAARVRGLEARIQELEERARHAELGRDNLSTMLEQQKEQGKKIRVSAGLRISKMTSALQSLQEYAEAADDLEQLKLRIRATGEALRKALGR